MGALSELERVDEGELSRPLRGRLAALLRDAFPHEGDAYDERAWRLVEPRFRVLALVAEEVAGQASVFEIATEPAYRLFGIGDVAVAEARRGHGLAAALCARAVEEAWSEGAEIQLTATRVLRGVFARLGFHPARGEEFFWLDGTVPRREDSWLYAVRAGVELPAPVRLEEGDF